MKSFINHFFIVCIKTFRPLLGPALCFYKPSCSNFVCEQLKTKSLFPALAASIKRLYSCSSFTI